MWICSDCRDPVAESMTMVKENDQQEPVFAIEKENIEEPKLEVDEVVDAEMKID